MNINQRIVITNHQNFENSYPNFLKSKYVSFYINNYAIINTYLINWALLQEKKKKKTYKI